MSRYEKQSLGRYGGLYGTWNTPNLNGYVFGEDDEPKRVRTRRTSVVPKKPIRTRRAARPSVFKQVSDRVKQKLQSPWRKPASEAQFIQHRPIPVPQKPSASLTRPGILVPPKMPQALDPVGPGLAPLPMPETAQIPPELPLPPELPPLMPMALMPRIPFQPGMMRGPAAPIMRPGPLTKFQVTPQQARLGKIAAALATGLLLL